MQKDAASLTIHSVCRLLASKSVITEQTAVPEEIPEIQSWNKQSGS